MSCYGCRYICSYFSVHVAIFDISVGGGGRGCVWLGGGVWGNKNKDIDDVNETCALHSVNLILFCNEF